MASRSVAKNTPKPLSEPRRALADLTNDSPIGRLASLATATDDCRQVPLFGTPSGDDALRSEVKLLLQKVDNDIHKAPSLRTLSQINGFFSSPSRFAAPTPANTPASSVVSALVASPRRAPLLDLDYSPRLPIYVDVSPFSPPEFAKEDTAEKSSKSLSNSPPSKCLEAKQELLNIEEVEKDHLEQPNKSAFKAESPKTKFEVQISTSYSSDSSPVQSVEDTDDDDLSDWSVLVNVNSPGQCPDGSVGDNVLSDDMRNTLWQNFTKTQEGYKLEFIWDQRDDEENDFEDRESHLAKAKDEDSDDGYYEGEGFGEADECEDLCEGLSRMDFKDIKRLPEYEGKHIRFIYNSDDEIEGEEVILSQDTTVNEAASENVVKFKGLPTPVGKHIRFSEEDEDLKHEQDKFASHKRS